MDEWKREVIVVGKGVGFQKKTGDEIDLSKVEKIFRFTPEKGSQFAQLVNSMPYEYVQLAEEIITLAGKTLQKYLNKNIYITLTDHLNFAIERQKQGIYFQNALLWEIKRFYPEEYQIGLDALELVYERIGIVLPEDEAGFLALHIVNARMNSDMPKTAAMPETIKGMLDIVRSYFKIDLNEDTLEYERFVTHLKFYLQRVIQKKGYSTEDEEFNHNIWSKYPQSFECAKKIQDYVSSQIDQTSSDEEITYLVIHIQRVVRISRKKDSTF